MLAELFREFVVQDARQRGTAADEITEMRQFRRVGAVHKELEHGRHAVHGVDMVFVDEFHGIAVMEGLLHDDGGAEIQVAADRRDPGEAVVHGQHAQGDILFMHVDAFGNADGVGHDAALGQDGALGAARRARRVDDGHGLFRFAVHGVERRSRRRNHFLEGELFRRLFHAQLSQGVRQFNRLLGNEHLHARILADIGDFRRHELEIDGHHDGPCQRAGKIGLDELRAVLADEADAVPFPDTPGLQEGRLGFHVLPELAVRRDLVLENEGRLFRRVVLHDIVQIQMLHFLSPFRPTLAVVI